MDQKTEQRFTDYLVEAANRSQREAGYNPGLFRQMLATEGGYRTAVKLLAANKVSDGFEKLWEKGRLDLSVEALVLQPDWATHFPQELLATAETRLNQVGFRSRAKGSLGASGSIAYWVLYHKRHEAEFSGDTFHGRSGPRRGDHAFVVLGDKPRNTSYLLAGEYEVVGVDSRSVEFNGRKFECRFRLRPITAPEQPVHLSEAVGVDMQKFRDRHASGIGIRTVENATREVFQKLLGPVATTDERSTDIANLAVSELPATTVMQQVEARLGQGKFRENVIAAWSIGERCALTGISVREVLTASHIIPWAEDERLRLEGTNGILLCAHVDRLFDRHLISFHSDGRLLGSSKLDASNWKELAQLGVKPGMPLQTSMLNLTNKQLIFERLRRHRERMQDLQS